MDRPANDVTNPARTVWEFYVIDPVTKLPIDPRGSGGGGGGATVTASAAAPTYTEGSTANALSANLSGDLRVISKQAGTWNIGSITTLPALATGANVIGGVTQSGTWNVGSITTLPALVAGSAIIGKVGIDQTTGGTTNGVVLKKANGDVIDPDVPAIIDSGVKYVDVTLSTDTSAYASGDLIADAQIVAACVRSNDATGALHSVMVIDEDDQKAAFTIYLASAAASWGTENSPPSITDANARTILGFVDFATGDYKDLGGVSVAFKGSAGMAITPATGTDDIYVAVVNGSGTPTYTATGLKLRLGFLV